MRRYPGEDGLIVASRNWLVGLGAGVSSRRGRVVSPSLGSATGRTGVFSFAPTLWIPCTHSGGDRRRRRSPGELGSRNCTYRKDVHVYVLTYLSDTFHLSRTIGCQSFIHGSVSISSRVLAVRYVLSPIHPSIAVGYVTSSHAMRRVDSHGHDRSSFRPPNSNAHGIP